MKYRVNNPGAAGYENYGGRGIRYDPRWEVFENFLADMGEPPSERHTIERSDSNGDYCKDNCRWATVQEQVRNRRNSVIIEFNGRTQNLVDWAAELGVNPSTLSLRLRKWPKEVALTTPPIPRSKSRSWKAVNQT